MFIRKLIAKPFVLARVGDETGPAAAGPCAASRYRAWRGTWTGGRPGPCWTGLDWTGLDWTGLDWAGLGWAGLGWAGLGWAGSGLAPGPEGAVAPSKKKPAFTPALPSPPAVGIRFSP
ncbi:hypothetical protein CEY04_06195 [Achromobacter sp. HZ28]|nr:hypothetical protein CEY05_06205 [Achromobacter sp. HZ34]OWT81469.1 hypothetical protein CEY04_06195 [Achromobacter sp. HZ28]